MVDETEIEGLGLARVGQLVRHPKFGRGVIEGLFVYENGTKIVSVDFGGIVKGLHPQYASLTPLKKNWW